NGMREILSKQAEGFAEIIKSANGKSDDAVRLLIADKLEELMIIQGDAIKNIKIDKVTVWDSNANSTDKSATAGFLSGIMKSIPPMNELFNMAGMKLPEYLGKEIENKAEAIQPTESTDTAK
ncbi:MAG: flotillin family protein, partial [Eubacteriales bacterium]|nr:flotillin family protein [Eubacteriales bacterium]